MGNCNSRSTVIDNQLEPHEDSHQEVKSKVERKREATANIFERIPKANFQSIAPQINPDHNYQKERKTIDYSKAIIAEMIIQQNDTLKQLSEENIKLMQESTQQWSDPEFKPEFSSLCAFPETYTKGQTYKWLRAKDIDGLGGENLNIFEGGIRPQDIKQGALGDCYLLSSLAAMAENEEQQWISRLFQDKKPNASGIYGVWLCIMGEWRLVLVDDYFPCNSLNHPAYSKSNGPELWVLLIEKAYAKAYGNYKKIEAGLTGQAIRDLTGSPYTYHGNDDPEEVWQLLEDYDNNQNMITAGSQYDPRGSETKQDTGIISGHAYSILGHREVEDSQGQKARIVQLRNPWGSHEWNGRFSDNSNDWTDYWRKELNVVKSDDGIFWMPIEDYCREYSETCINYLYPDYEYSSLRVETGGHRQYSISFNVNYNIPNGHITVSQKSDRWFEDAKGNTEYQYSLVRLVVMKKISDTEYYLIGDTFKNARDVDIKGSYTPGEYIVLVEVDWTQDYANDFVVSAYTESPVTLNEAQKLNEEEFVNYIDYAIMYKDLGSLQAKSIRTYFENEPLFRARSTLAGYLFFLYINNSNYVLQEKGMMSNRKHLEIQAPYENNDEYEVKVEPGEKVIVKYRINEDGQGSYGFGMKYQTATGRAGVGC